MISLRASLLVTTYLSSATLARDDTWYVDGTGACEPVYELPCGEVGYDFGEIRGYDFPGITLGAHTPLIEEAEREKYIRFSR